MTAHVPNVPLWQRARPLSDVECADIRWLAVITLEQRERARSAMRAATAQPGDFLCRIGKPPNYFFGVLDGLLKMSNDSSAGPAITFTGIPPGAWFGEGTLLKREPYRYNIQALRRSTVAGLPIDAFHELLETSIAFNRFILNQLNERVGQFIAAREIDRLNDTDTRVARGLAAMFHPVLYPGVGKLLRITQQELGYVVGLSRQRVNEALNALQRHKLIQVEYGGVRVLDLEGLRTANFRGRRRGLARMMALPPDIWPARRPLIAILRGIQSHEAVAHARALLDAGIDCIEVPTNSPQWERSVQAIVAHAGDRALVGAGTVWRRRAPRRARRRRRPPPGHPAHRSGTRGQSAGAGPRDRRRLRHRHRGFRRDHRWRARAQALSRRTARARVCRGAARGAPNEVPLIAVGGVRPDNLAEFVEAGCAGAGLGGELYRPGQTPLQTHERAKAFLAAWPG
jgi:2-keto-3-deoxy-6-phosphogluconate aldolase/CRP-like cAMP-binding protein